MNGSASFTLCATPIQRPARVAQYLPVSPPPFLSLSLLLLTARRRRRRRRRWESSQRGSFSSRSWRRSSTFVAEARVAGEPRYQASVSRARVAQACETPPTPWCSRSCARYLSLARCDLDSDHDRSHGGTRALLAFVASLCDPNSTSVSLTSIRHGRVERRRRRRRVFQGEREREARDDDDAGGRRRAVGFSVREIVEDNRWVVAIVASDCGVISSLIDQVRYSADSTAPRSHTHRFSLRLPRMLPFLRCLFSRYLPALSLSVWPFSRPVSLRHALQHSQHLFCRVG